MALSLNILSGAALRQKLRHAFIPKVSSGFSPYLATSLYCIHLEKLGFARLTND